MRKKQILIVDDERAILAVLKGSLKKMETEYEVTTVMDGFSALDVLQEKTFDLVVTDFNMEGMDGLELVEAVHYQQPQAKIVMMTAYGYKGLKEDVGRFDAFRYLTKPLEIDTFRQVVKEALEDAETKRPNIFMLSDEQYNQVHALLKQLQIEVNGRCLFLTSTNGNTIARIGDAGKLAVEEIASLLSGGLVSLAESGRILDGDEDSINLAYREGKNEYLYAINVGEKLLLTLIINRTAYSSRLGTVWYYTQQAAVSLSKILAETTEADMKGFFDNQMDEAFDQELDKLLGGNDFY